MNREDQLADLIRRTPIDKPTGTIHAEHCPCTACQAARGAAADDLDVWWLLVAVIALCGGLWLMMEVL